MTPTEYRAAKHAKRERRAAGRQACERGEHPRPLTWLHYSKLPIRVDGQPTEMMVASGLVGGSNVITMDGRPMKPLAAYNGHCSRCGSLVEWASSRRAIHAGEPRRARAALSTKEPT